MQALAPSPVSAQSDQEKDIDVVDLPPGEGGPCLSSEDDCRRSPSPPHPGHGLPHPALHALPGLARPMPQFQDRHTPPPMDFHRGRETPSPDFSPDGHHGLRRSGEDGSDSSPESGSGKSSLMKG